MYELEDLCNPLMREYYLMTLCDLEDGLEVEAVEKAVEDLFEDGRFAECAGIYLAVGEFKHNQTVYNIIDGKEEN